MAKEIFKLTDKLSGEVNGKKIRADNDTAKRISENLSTGTSVIFDMVLAGSFVSKSFMKGRSEASILATKFLSNSSGGEVNKADFTDRFYKLFFSQVLATLKKLSVYKNDLNKFRDNIKNKKGMIINHAEVTPSVPVVDSFDETKNIVDDIATRLLGYKHYLISNLADKDYLMYGEIYGKQKVNLSRVLSFVVLFFDKNNEIYNVLKEIRTDYIKDFSSTSDPTIQDISNLYRLQEILNALKKGVDECLEVVFGKEEVQDTEIRKSIALKIEILFLEEGKTSSKNSIRLESTDDKYFFAYDDGGGNNLKDAVFKIQFNEKGYKKFMTENKGNDSAELMDKLIDNMVDESKILQITGAYGMDKSIFKSIITNGVVPAHFDDTNQIVTFRLDRTELENVQSGPSDQLLATPLRTGANSSPILIFKVTGRQTNDGKPSTVFASQEDESIKKVAETATTQPLYKTKDPDGNDIIFSPRDLVKGRGKIKSKSGKDFKPSKWKSHSLKDIVKNWKPKGK